MNKLILILVIAVALLVGGVWYLVSEPEMESVSDEMPTTIDSAEEADDNSFTPAAARPEPSFSESRPDASDGTRETLDTEPAFINVATPTEIETDYAPPQENEVSGESVDPELIPDLSVS